MEIAREAVLHYALDAQLIDAGGVVIFDSFGKAHSYKFRAMERLGLSLTLDSQTVNKTMSAEELRDLASSIEDDEELVDFLLDIADRAEDLGTPFRLTIKPVDAGRGHAIRAVPAEEGRQATIEKFFTEQQPTFSVRRPPVPWVGIGLPLLLALTSAAIYFWQLMQS